MRASGRGILPESQIYIYEASELARRLYLYSLCAGHYHCGPNYVVDRQFYNSFLMLYMKSGSGYYISDGRRHDIATGSFALIDCYKPHVYGSNENCEFYWVHFDGSTARELYEIIAASGIVPRHHDRSSRAIINICMKTETHSGHLEEAEMHRLLTDLIMEFLITAETRTSESTDTIEDVRNYILDNPEKDLSLEQLAQRARLSPYHFLRQFKLSVGMTPHEYLIACRLNIAKFYLVTSSDSIKEIAFSCGFSCVSNFCACFKHNVGMTPSEYRSRHTS